MSLKAVLKKNKWILNTYTKLVRNYRCVLTMISPRLNTLACYKAGFGKKLDLNNPVTLNEKILKLKLDCYGTDPLVRQCADKFAVRKYIAEKGCSEILVPLYKSYDAAKEIVWEELPKAFAMKWNFGCGFNIICDDKSRMDEKQVVSQMKKWGRVKYHLAHSEMQYKGVKKKILVEEYLQPKEGKLPEDYKVYCFHGEAKYVMLCVGREFGHPKFLFFDRNFNFMRHLSRDGLSMPEGFTMEKPAGFDKLIHFAEILSEPFPFVRADFYLLEGAVYFGELTFTPAGGLDARMLPEVDRMMGDLV